MVLTAQKCEREIDYAQNQPSGTEMMMIRTSSRGA
jgi:hypothetical protein